MTFRAAFALQRVDKGLDQIRKNLDLIGQGGDSYVQAGVIGAAAEADRGAGMTSARLALIHEFGAPEAGIPARPFILPSFEKNREAYRRLLIGLIKTAVFRGQMPFSKALALIGAKMAADMKAFVVGGAPIPPPNSPATIARKLAKGAWKGRPAPAEGPGSPRTLVDTGRMVGAITWEVVKK